MRNELEKGLDELSGAYEEERRRQLAAIQQKVAERQKHVSEHAEEQRVLAEKKRLQDEKDRLAELDRVRVLRQNKIELGKKISER